MEEVKQKTIELLLDIISKEDFEMILYEKIKTEDLLKNKLLFDLVNVNYRKESYKNQLLEVIEEFIPEEAFIIYKLNLYSSNIKDEDDYKNINKYFDQIFCFFDYDKEHNLMWDFYMIRERIGLVEMKYEKEEEVIKDLKVLCNKVFSEFKKSLTIEEKIKLLVDGFQEEIVLENENFFQLKKKTIVQKKWYQFWK